MPFLTQGKTNWKFLVIVIVLAMIVGGAVLWCVKTSEQPYLLSETSEPERVAEDETADWLTYSNEDYGFEIGYPWFYQPGEPIRWTPASRSLANLSHKDTNALDILIFDNSFNEYELVDNPGGFIFRFDIETEQWLHKDGSVSEFVPQKLDIDIEAYIYKSGDINCRWDLLIIPHPSYSYVVEIINTTCGDMERDYELPDFILDSKQLLSTFKFTEETCFKGKLEWAIHSDIQEIADEKLQEIIIQQIIKEFKEHAFEKDVCDIKNFGVSGETVDLNNDGVLEYIIYPQGVVYSDDSFSVASLGLGRGGGPIYIFKFIQGEWKPLGDFYGAWAKPIKSRWTKGYVNLVTQLNMTAYSHMIYEYAWNGETYELIKTVDWGGGTQNPDGPPKEYWELWEGQG